MAKSPHQKTPLRLGTRGSLLARIQSQWVADRIQQIHPRVHVELTIIKTSGDQIADRPLHEFGGKGLFVRELERALLDGAIDLAVHSFKDVPVTMPLVDQENLLIAAVPPREDERDALVSLKAASIAELPPSARVGTTSLRRRAQLLALRPDLQIENVRGNIDTRLRKLREGQFDVVILAMAGLKRAALFDAAFMHPIPPNQMLPAAGQGALAIQCRRDDAFTIGLLNDLHDPGSGSRVAAERELVRLLEGDCSSPIAALASVDGDTLRLSAAIGRKGGVPPLLRFDVEGALADSARVIARAWQALLDLGVGSHLHGD